MTILPAIAREQSDVVAQSEQGFHAKPGTISVVYYDIIGDVSQFPRAKLFRQLFGVCVLPAPAQPADLPLE